jgi:hypothetical protein
MNQSITSCGAIREDKLSKPGFLPNLICLVGGLVVFFFALLFILPWWNRYLGLTNEGWYQFFGKQILQGRIPCLYRQDSPW